ncbi:hypothetical protein ACGFIF_11175 [Kribbella sp. NPDC049174]|uniref:hypothetical protein n=1 Tax=Kribbella sp. NPDC049174 TaxID=3364112 RepID=UPI00372211B0
MPEAGALRTYAGTPPTAAYRRRGGAAAGGSWDADDRIAGAFDKPAGAAVRVGARR